MRSALGGVTLATAGLRLAAGNGSADDWGVIQTARKEHRCEHQGPNSRRLTTPCQHADITKGETYLLVRQGYLDAGPLALDCALAAEIIVKEGNDA